MEQESLCIPHGLKLEPRDEPRCWNFGQDVSMRFGLSRSIRCQGQINMRFASKKETGPSYHKAWTW